MLSKSCDWRWHYCLYFTCVPVQMNKKHKKDQTLEILMYTHTSSMCKSEWQWKGVGVGEEPSQCMGGANRLTKKIPVNVVARPVMVGNISWHGWGNLGNFICEIFWLSAWRCLQNFVKSCWMSACVILCTVYLCFMICLITALNHIRLHQTYSIGPQ